MLVKVLLMVEVVVIVVADCVECYAGGDNNAVRGVLPDLQD